jgi:hypothetical protein
MINTEIRLFILKVLAEEISENDRLTNLSQYFVGTSEIGLAALNELAHFVADADIRQREPNYDRICRDKLLEYASLLKNDD